MISSINTYLNGIIKNLDEYNDRNVPKKNLNKSENTDSTETKNTEIKSSIESNVLSTKNFFCEKCTSLFRVDLGFNHNKKNDYRLDFMPIGNERFKDNFVKCLLESDCVCPHSINILDKTSIGNMNIYNVISFDNFLKRKASELGYNSDLDKSHKQASLYYLYASWFTNNKSKSENYLDLASSENMIYNLSLMSTNKTIENRDVLYDLIFLDVQRKQGENFDYCVSMAKLTYNNILSTDIDDDTQFHTMDIPNLIKIIEAQINLASKGDTKDYTLSKIGVNYIDCFTMIGRFLQQKI